MNSRYNFMAESKVTDTDGDTYPDPLSISYGDTKFSDIPAKHVVSAGDISKFWLYMYNNYQVCEYDDILLSLNGIPYIGTLEPGDVICQLPISDIMNFSTNKA